MNNILLVEDDDNLLRIVAFFLEKQGFHVTTYKSPASALEHLRSEESKYDIILSDVMMPNMNGFEFCEATKTLDAYASTPFMIISALVDIESKIRGFNLGIDDYIEKPPELDILDLKIKSLITRHRNELNLRKQIDEAQDSVQNIMNFYSDLGGVLDFYKESIGTSSFDELTTILFKTLTGYGLNASVCYFLPEEIKRYSCNGDMSPLELNVIQAVRDKSRFFTHENKLFINYTDFTLFIKNMPTDEDRAGILRDSIGVLTNGVEAQLKNIIASEKIKTNKLMSQDTEKIVESAKDIQKQLETAMAKAIESLLNNITEAFFTLGLTEPQEEQILGLISACDKQIQDGLRIGDQLVEHVDKISINLKDMRKT